MGHASTQRAALRKASPLCSMLQHRPPAVPACLPVAADLWKIDILFVVGGRGGNAAAELIHRECRAKKASGAGCRGEAATRMWCRVLVCYTTLCRMKVFGSGSCEIHPRGGGCSCRLALQVPCCVVAVPKSIDNDLLLVRWQNKERTSICPCAKSKESRHSIPASNEGFLKAAPIRKCM